MGDNIEAVTIGDYQLGGDRPLFILGPCVIESEAFIRKIASQIKSIADEVGVDMVFKASYDLSLIHISEPTRRI